MQEYELTIMIKDSGVGVAKVSVKAASDYNARRLVEATYDKGKVTIINCRKID